MSSSLVEKNFFEEYPEHRWVASFNELIFLYGEERASKYMWAIYMAYNPKSSIWNMPTDEKREEISSTFLGNDKDIVDRTTGEVVTFWSIADDAITSYIDVCMSFESKMYVDARKLYESAMRDGHSLKPKDRAIFLKSLSGTSALLEDLKSKYVLSEERGADKKNQGMQKSGWASKKSSK